MSDELVEKLQTKVRTQARKLIEYEEYTQQCEGQIKQCQKKAAKLKEKLQIERFKFQEAYEKTLHRASEGVQNSKNEQILQRTVKELSEKLEQTQFEKSLIVNQLEALKLARKSPKRIDLDCRVESEDLQQQFKDLTEKYQGCLHHITDLTLEKYHLSKQCGQIDLLQGNIKYLEETLDKERNDLTQFCEKMKDKGINLSVDSIDSWISQLLNCNTDQNDNGEEVSNFYEQQKEELLHLLHLVKQYIPIELQDTLASILDNRAVLENLLLKRIRYHDASTDDTITELSNKIKEFENSFGDSQRKNEDVASNRKSESSSSSSDSSK